MVGRMQEKVQLLICHVDRVEKRMEAEWPSPRKEYGKFHVNFRDISLRLDPITEGQNLVYEIMGDGLTSLSCPLTEETEITGPSAPQMSLSSSIENADIYNMLGRLIPMAIRLSFRTSLIFIHRLRWAASEHAAES